MPKRVYIYCLKLDGVIQYVGRSVNPDGRANVHRRRWQQPFEMQVLEEYDTFEEACAAERRLIAQHRPRYNARVTASGATTPSEAARRKVAASLTGKVQTERHKANISAAKRGKVMSAEFKAKRSVIMKERYKDPAERQRTSELSRGRIHTAETRAKISASARSRQRGHGGRWL